MTSYNSQQPLYNEQQKGKGSTQQATTPSAIAMNNYVPSSSLEKMYSHRVPQDEANSTKQSTQSFTQLLQQQSQKGNRYAIPKLRKNQSYKNAVNQYKLA